MSSDVEGRHQVSSNPPLSPFIKLYQRGMKGGFWILLADRHCWSNSVEHSKRKALKDSMTIFDGELGLQFVTHLANHYTVPDLVRLAQLAAEKGFKQIWVNDNIRYRSQLVVLTAIAARLPVRLGTAIMVPYFHNPLDWRTHSRHCRNCAAIKRSVSELPAAISVSRPSMFKR